MSEEVHVYLSITLNLGPTFAEPLRHYFATQSNLKELIMSSFSDLSSAQSVTDAKITQLGVDVTTLLTKLAAIPTVGLTPEQQTALDAAVTHALAINDSINKVDSSAVGTPAPILSGSTPTP
jgi:hypothetical protein